jgi:hypothetical protein
MGEEDEAARDAIGETPEPPPELDHLLRFLVTIVDKADFEVGVTLNVGGLLGSGLPVGYDKYAEGVVSQLKLTRVTESRGWRRGQGGGAPPWPSQNPPSRVAARGPRSRRCRRRSWTTATMCTSGR